MATRHNACVNPALANNNTGWGGASTPTRTAVTGFGRPWAARYTTGTYIATASGVAAAGQQFTVSIDVRVASFNVATVGVYVEWLNSGGSTIGFSSTNYALTAGVVTRMVTTGTAPANTAGVHVVVDGVNASVNQLDATMVLLEQVATADTYFDGDSPSASWDGTAGNSASTLTDTPVVAVTARSALALAGTSIARKVVSAAGRATAALAGTAAARKVTLASGRAVVAVAGSTLARKAAPVSVSGVLPLAATAAVKKVTVSAPRGMMALVGTGTARKRAPATGASYALLVSYHSQVTARPVTGMSSLALGARGLAVKVARATSSAPVVLTGTATARHRAAAAGVSSFVLAGTAAGQHRATAAAPAGLLLAGTGSARRIAAVTGFGVLLLSVHRGDGPPPGPTRGQMSASARIGSVMRTRQRTGATMSGGPR